jgi:hypothetical protein
VACGRAAAQAESESAGRSRCGTDWHGDPPGAGRVDQSHWQSCCAAGGPPSPRVTGTPGQGPRLAAAGGPGHWQWPRPLKLLIEPDGTNPVIMIFEYSQVVSACSTADN